MVGNQADDTTRTGGAAHRLHRTPLLKLAYSNLAPQGTANWRLGTSLWVISAQPELGRNFDSAATMDKASCEEQTQSPQTVPHL